MYVPEYLGLLRSSEQQLADALMAVSERHADLNPDVHITGQHLAAWSRQHVAALAPFIERYGARDTAEPERLRRTLLQGPRDGGYGLLRDLQETCILAQEVFLDWLILSQAARALRDVEFQATCEELSRETKRQCDWLHTTLHESSPEIMVVPV